MSIFTKEAHLAFSAVYVLGSIAAIGLAPIRAAYAVTNADEWFGTTNFGPFETAEANAALVGMSQSVVGCVLCALGMRSGFKAVD